MPVQRRPNSIRHPDADYSDPGMYFVTLCTQDRDPLFGEVTNGEIRCSPFGGMVWDGVEIVARAVRRYFH